MEQIARYRISGRLSDKQIGELVGLTPAGLKYLISQPQYIELETSLLEGYISRMDMELAENVENLRGRMRQAVPVAQRTLIEACLQRRDMRAALVAAKEILDRDPDHNFSKASVTTTPPTAPGFNPATAANVIGAMTHDASKITAQITIHKEQTLKGEAASQGQLNPVESLARSSPPPAQIPLFGDAQAEDSGDATT